MWISGIVFSFIILSHQNSEVRVTTQIWMQTGRVLDSSDEAFQRKSRFFFFKLKLIRAPSKNEIFKSQVTESQRINDNHHDDKQIFIRKKATGCSITVRICFWFKNSMKAKSLFQNHLFTFNWAARIHTCIIFFCGSFNTNIMCTFWIWNEWHITYTMGLEIRYFIRF